MAKKHITKIDWLNLGLEFSVVLIGILIAFQLNNCSNKKSNRKKVQTHLQQIAKEAEFNQYSIANTLEAGKQTVAQLDTILHYLQAYPDTTALDRLILNLTEYNSIYIRRNAYLSLLQSGDIQLIEQYQTTQDIINLYEYYKWVESLNQETYEIFLYDFFPFIEEHFSLTESTLQDRTIYQNQKFRNTLFLYRQSKENTLEKLDACLEEIEAYLSTSK